MCGARRQKGSHTSPTALALILTAAVIHASWNLLAKRAGDGGFAFVWLNGALSTLIYAPLAAFVVLFLHPQIGSIELFFMFGTGVLHLGYFLLLQKGYRVGDLSLVYPLARGTGPVLATAVAIVFLGERPTFVALSGASLIAVGVFMLTGGLQSARGGAATQAVAYGILTGSFIAAYTLWDKYAVSLLLIPPLLLNWSANLGRASLLMPFAVRGWAQVRTVWSNYRFEVIGVALLEPISYILVLTALVFTPVSYVAPAREISILIGTLMGARLLTEDASSRRLVAAGAMVLGVSALALGCTAGYV